jgi:glucose/arabinose dehydrogenase
MRRCRGHGFALVLLCLAGLAYSPPAHAGTLPSGFQDDAVLSGLTEPSNFAFAPDGRVFVGEKSGVIKVFDGLGDTTSTQVADLRSDVYNFWDRGLLGMALDPEFPTRPYLYVLYTRDALPGGTSPHWGTAGEESDPCPDPPGATTDGCVVTGRLARLTITGNASTAQTNLITDWCQQYPSHSVGDLAFGQDGQLYVSGGEGASFFFADWGQEGNPVNPCGDPPGGPGTDLSPPTAEGGSLRSQDARTTSDPTGLDGSILRVDPDTGAGSAGNPFAASADANQRRIVGFGLRNPFRFTFRPGTNEIWAGDVGQDTWEEIDRLVTPADSTADNFGWPCYEGAGHQPSFDAANLNLCESLYGSGSVVQPYYTYNHSAHVVSGESCSTGSSSISGLAFYPGGPFPASYDGALFFADHSRECIWAMFPGSNGLPNPSNIITFDAGADGPVKLAIGPGGDLYYADFDGGTIHRISFNAGNSPPQAVATATPSNGHSPLLVQFDASDSSDPDGDTLSYDWDLDGDGQFDDSTIVNPSRTYSAGIYNVGVKVSDPDGASDTFSLQVQSGNTPPIAELTAPQASDQWAVGDTVDFAGDATDEQDTLPDSAFHWQVILNHCPSNCHEHFLQSFDGVRDGSFPAPDHDYPSSLTVQLTVTDSGGLSDTKSVTVNPRTVQLGILSSPPGAEIGLDLASGSAPFTDTVIQGSHHTVAAPSQFISGGQTYQFESWSDGGAIAHAIDVSQDTNLTAAYRSLLGPSLLGGSSVLGESTVSCAGEAATILGTKRSDVLVGTKGNDVIAGRGGKDRLKGKGGDDLLCGGSGADVIKGGGGDDVLKGGADSDLCRGGPGSDRTRGCERPAGH